MLMKPALLKGLVSSNTLAPRPLSLRMRVRASGGSDQPPKQDTPNEKASEQRAEAPGSGMQPTQLNTPPPPPQPPRPPPRPQPISLGQAFAFDGPLPEAANGRLAMLGFVTAVAAELMTGTPVLTQFYEASTPIINVAVLVTAASLVPLLMGAGARSFGPFTPQVELLNGRAAMLGFASLLAWEAFLGRAFF